MCLAEVFVTKLELSICVLSRSFCHEVGVELLLRNFWVTLSFKAAGASDLRRNKINCTAVTQCPYGSYFSARPVKS